MHGIFTELKNQLSNGYDSMFVTVTASHEATPRAAGAHMIVESKGRICGTIGGGTVEYRSEQLEMEAIKNHSSQLKHIELNGKDIENLCMICGGDVERITTPIGLFNVKDDTHAETAISIAGQLITLHTTGEIIQ